MKLMKHNFLYINCPICGKQLINLSDEIDRRCGYNWFWCDMCHIDIRIESEENKVND